MGARPLVSCTSIVPFLVFIHPLFSVLPAQKPTKMKKTHKNEKKPKEPKKPNKPTTHTKPPILHSLHGVKNLTQKEVSEHTAMLAAKHTSS